MVSPPFRSRGSTALLFAIILAVAVALAQSRHAAASPETADRTIVHALNRLTFGPRPGDVERVARVGLAKWIEQQLNPSRVDDSNVDRRLAAYRTLRLDSRAIAREYIEPARQARRNRQTGAGVMDPAERGDRVVVDELSSAKLLRAVYSERQLEEVLVDFWFNHFNVFARKGRTETYITEYERDVIRPHVFGGFRDLLEATARSPAMLVYLDNWLSAAPGMASGRRGLNENYARELLELHTLGVDGGYTQADVVAVARAFTGWTSFEAAYAETADAVLRGVGSEAFDAMRTLQRAAIRRYDPSSRVAYPRSPFGQALEEIGRLAKADVGLEVAFAESGNWDHHVNEGGAIGQVANRLDDLSRSIAALVEDLGDRISDTVIVTMSEFGRAVAENGNRGTDHGHGNAMMVIGGPVMGGRVYGAWPGLAASNRFEGRDLAVTTDFRDVFREVVARHLGVSDAALARIFPGYQGTRTLGIVKG